MALRTRFKIGVFISSTSNEEKDIADRTDELYSDVFEEGNTIAFVLAPSASDILITPPTLAEINFIAIKTVPNDPTLQPVAITIKLNSALGEEITITPVGPTPTTAKSGWLLLTTEGVTAIYASNPSADTAMKCTLFLAGDAA